MLCISASLPYFPRNIADGNQRTQPDRVDFDLSGSITLAAAAAGFGAVRTCH